MIRKILSPRKGKCYSNGDFGRHWAVRQIVEVSDARNVTYKVLVGPERRSTGTCTCEEFERWTRYEVVRNENSWERLAGG